MSHFSKMATKGNLEAWFKKIKQILTRSVLVIVILCMKTVKALLFFVSKRQIPPKLPVDHSYFDNHVSKIT